VLDIPGRSGDSSGVYVHGEIVHVTEGAGRMHVRAAAIAAIVSLGLHVLTVALLPSVRLSGVTAAHRPRPAQPERPALRVQDVRADAQTPEAWSEMVGVGAPVTSADIAQRTEELALAPDEVAMEPPPVTDTGMAAEDATLAEPSAVPERSVWEPRQEILAIEAETAKAELPELPRRTIPRVTRVPDAPDIVPPAAVPPARARADAVPLGAVAPAAVGEADVPSGPAAAGVVEPDEPTPLDIGEVAAVTGSGLFTETPSEITNLKHIESLLRARVETFTPFFDFQHGYFRVEIERAGPEVLPVLPRDIVFVQDCSASMSEQRLYFCRQGLRDAIGMLKPGDRFNVVAFRDQPSFCFDGWADVGEQSREKARRFVDSLRAGGNTDIFGSMKALLQLPLTPGRAPVALLVTDGLPTAGVTDSTDIIGEFSKLNDGAFSVFSIGTMQTANTYLLDLLSYCNRGDATVISGGRWGIPDEIKARFAGLRRPVLSDVRVRFAGSGVEVFPVQTSNLYLDKALVLYGRYPKELTDVVFQVVGAGARESCDMIFNLPLGADKEAKSKSIRENWAKQKIYHLIGEFARRPSQQTLDAMRETSRTYNVRVPHAGRF